MPLFVEFGDIKGDVTDSDSSSGGGLEPAIVGVEYLIATGAAAAADTSRSAHDDMPVEDVSFAYGQIAVAGGKSEPMCYLTYKLDRAMTPGDDALPGDLLSGTGAHETAESGHAKQIELSSWSFGEPAGSGGGGTGKVSVHDISISKHTDGADNVEMTVKVLDGGGPFYGAVTDVEYTLTVTDTETGQVTENESNLTYSGESGGLNEPIHGSSGHYTQLVWANSNTATGDQLGAPEASGPMKESMETMKKAWKDASSTPEGKTTSDGNAAQDGYTGTVSLTTSDPATSGPSDHEGSSDLTMPNEARTEATQNNYSWGIDRIDQSASGGGGTGKVSVHDISISKQSDDAGGVNVLFGDGSVGDAGDAAGPFVAYGDGFMGGVFVGASDAEHGTILTGNPADADRPIGPFKGVLVLPGGPEGGAAPGGHLFVATDVGVFEDGAGGAEADTQVNPPSWGLDRIDQHVGGSDLSDWQSHYGTGGAAAASSGGGGAGKVSFQDMSMTVSVPKAAEHDTVELVKFDFSFDKIEMEPGGDPGADDLLFADADAAALGNTYQGMTTIQQGVIEVDHGLIMLNYQYDLG